MKQNVAAKVDHLHAQQTVEPNIYKESKKSDEANSDPLLKRCFSRCVTKNVLLRSWQLTLNHTKLVILCGNNIAAICSFIVHFIFSEFARANCIFICNLQLQICICKFVRIVICICNLQMQFTDANYETCKFADTTKCIMMFH